ncbi:50S ribosomal protein L3 [Cerasicoccus arenae]|uniref:Large ribosomal subunit protein uL3 n=1 Tax=Cerasicoccus arenae TaxID=424488 RepID=A0A8J3DDY7_9BACT|nr:50S ribosomal protein L3 [Cerasicoccus arenae]MBK1857329.1 50S ribosomal protein L3 [Cerasicoccus arenae]GHC08789.1 50S ribosomal protein L3 [Cerasicoccus arenae]
MSFTLIGKKIGMTQIFDGNQLVPVTVVEAGPCPVVQVKSSEKDGYEAVQIGFGVQKLHRISKPIQGHFAKAKVEPVHQLREFRVGADDAEYNVGDVLTVSKFEAGQRVDVIGMTKGKGFQGVMKRWNFAGGPASHGHMTHRRGGSYGQCQWPGEVWKGKKMPGHMGNARRTTQNLTIVKVLEDKNLLLIKGSVHGSIGGTVYVRTAVKKKRSA